MHIIIYSAVCLVFTKIQAKSVLNDPYKNALNALKTKKQELFALEDQEALGAAITLDDDEKAANNILMECKYKELDESFNKPQYYNFSQHYLLYRQDIEKSKVYQIIKRMPKGGALHIHNSMMLDIDTVMNFTKDPDLYICFGKEYFALLFSESTPTRPCPGEWGPLHLVRSIADNVTKFDEDFSQFFALHVRDPEEFIEGDINYIWEKFDQVYRNVKTLITYRPVREKYIYQSLKKLYDDNIMYAEFRTGLHSVYEIDGSTHDKKYSIEMFRRVAEDFKKAYPDFIGVKLILTRHRTHTPAQVKDALTLARAFKREYPDMIAGFDLIGQEDKGRPLSDFLPELSEAKNDIAFYLHAGETNWNGMSTDKNLFDAVVLGSKRIGHAYALAKHPSLIQAIINKDIAIEASVISNNVLGLVKDLRNHPLATYLAVGLPVVISSDDPGVWGAEPASHDFFVTFMGIANRDADLRLLKQLALNSITYSSLSDELKGKFKEVFDRRWKSFIQDVIVKKGL